MSQKIVLTIKFNNKIEAIIILRHRLLLTVKLKTFVVFIKVKINPFLYFVRLRGMFFFV